MDLVELVVNAARRNDPNPEVRAKAKHELEVKEWPEAPGEQVAAVARAEWDRAPRGRDAWLGD